MPPKRCYLICQRDNKVFRSLLSVGNTLHVFFSCTYKRMKKGSDLNGKKEDIESATIELRSWPAFSGVKITDLNRAPKAWLNQGASLLQPTRLTWLSNQAYQALPYVQKAWLTKVFRLFKKYSRPVLPCVIVVRERITASTLLKQFSSIFLLDDKLQLRYTGLPPVDGCGKEKNSKVVFYFECGNSVGQPEFQR